MQNAIGVTDVIPILDAEITDKEIILPWVLGHLVTDDVGTTVFVVQGYAQEDESKTLIWQSGRRYISITQNMEAEPTYESQFITQLEEFFATVLVELPTVLEARDNANEAAETASEAAEEARELTEAMRVLKTEVEEVRDEGISVIEAARELINSNEQVIQQLSVGIGANRYLIDEILRSYVSSVNNETGDVKITYSSIGALPEDFRIEVARMIKDAVDAIVDGNEVEF